MASRFSKKYGNRMSFQLSANKRCLSAYIPTSLPQEQAAKTDMLSVVSIHVLCTVEEGVAMLAYD